MKKFLTILAVCLLVSINIFANTVNGSFSTNLNGSRLEVTIAAGMQSGTGSAGVVSLEFTFNSSALSAANTPVSGTDFVLEGGFAGYNTKNVTRPSANKIRINLVTTGTPVSLSTSPVNICTLYLTITNPALTSNLQWTETHIASAFLQPYYSSGNWVNLDKQLHPLSVNGQFRTEVNNSKLEVNVDASIESETGSAGVVSLEFTFDASVLSFPENPVNGTDFALQGGFTGYNTKNITRPSENTVRISLVTTGTPAVLTTTPISIVKLYFTLLDAYSSPNLVWIKTEIAPVFLQANYPAGTWLNSQSPLPVEVVSFVASASGKNIELKWETASETNNYGFEVERASLETTPCQDCLNWEKIGFVNGNGNSNSPKKYTFIDQNPAAGNLEYRLKQINTDGGYTYYSNIAEVNYAITDVKDKQVPEEYGLSQNYPNPFNPTTKIQYAVGSGSIGNNSQSSEQLVTLKVYDILGNEVTTLVNEHKAPGYYEVEFFAGSLATGVYIYRLNAGSFTATKKLMLMK